MMSIVVIVVKHKNTHDKFNKKADEVKLDFVRLELI
jgi:hypothetical protein